jgi:hypothetical protein
MSAFYGQPPNTTRDADIIRGTFLVDFRINTFNASGGIPFAPAPPPGYVHENRQAAIIGGMYVIPESFITVLGSVRSHQESVLGVGAVARGTHVANNSRDRLLITPDTAVKGNY